MRRRTPYVIKQTDQALERALAFIQAQQAGEISYGRGGRSAGCIATHSTFQERWLQVKWCPAVEMNRFVWDGELLSVGLQGVSKPRIFGYFDWEAIGLYYRATMMSVAHGLISKARIPDSAPVLEPQWWDRLKNAIGKIQAKQTDRIYVEHDQVAHRLSERFGLKLRTFPPWQTAHGDLHWANLTAPEFSIIDWETWGHAPYGFDIASLHLFSLAQPELVTKLKQEFSAVMARPAYDLALLYLAAEEMHRFDVEGRGLQLQDELRRETERVLAERRYAEFCE
jgi:Phosphotransferase enzyme family